MVTNKSGDHDRELHEKEGYVQLSYAGEPAHTMCVMTVPNTHGNCLGENHALLLHHVVAFAAVGFPEGHGQVASHRCGHTVCRTVGHVIWESPEQNESRKDCLVWVQCIHPGCTILHPACEHKPPCIRTIPGVTWEEFTHNPGAHIHGAVVDEYVMRRAAF